MSIRLQQTMVALALAFVSAACGDGAEVLPSPRTVARVSVAPDARDLIMGDSARLMAIALTQDGTQLPDRVIVWSSEHPSVVSVSPGGLVLAMATGIAIVRATCEGRVGTATIRVLPQPGPPAPAISSLTPDSAQAGGAGFMLLVKGTGFSAGAKVYWNNLRRITTRISDTELQAQIRQTDLALPGVFPITVINEDGDGSVSNERDFRVVVVPQPSRMSDVIYEGYPDGTEELMLFELPGIAPRRVQPGLAVMDPTPSPDGRQIAFVGVDEHQNYDIFVLQRTSAGPLVRQLTYDAERDEQPAWSPDGRSIAFRSTRGHLGDVWIMDVDGSNQRRITSDPLPGVFDDARPAWSPDGTRIVFSRGGGAQRSLWVVRSDGTDERQLTNTLDRDDQPAWAPDGSAIAFARTTLSERKTLITMVTPDGLPLTMAATVEGRAPAWSVDGRMLAYVILDPSGRPDIGLMLRDGSSSGYLVLDPQYRVAGINPAWIRK